MASGDRRRFLKAASGAAMAAGFGPSAIARALPGPANTTTRSIMDVGHVVILMQENRAFDHYFGTLRGVRGFGDPRPVTLPSGAPVWLQPDPKSPGGHVAPFHLDSRTTSAQVMESLDHSWKGSHARWKHHDAWIAAKTAMTMGYFDRGDLPFYYALADAFTICDAYHCSIFGPTNPNRMFLFTGTNGLTVGEIGALAVANPAAETNETADMANDSLAFAGFGWTTYAERLQAADVSWKVYQEHDNYGDNALAYFRAFRGLDRGSQLHARARAWAAGSTPLDAKTSRGEHLVAAFARDVEAGTLPQVSWIVAPYIMCEHPSASPGYGEALTARLIDALASRPEVWARTVFILNYDENDGFFDHVPPPVPAINPAMGRSTAPVTGEVYAGEPVGLGPRVPMIAVSPWSRGGFVNSEVFDHTSVIRFLETRFGVPEPNISPWRRTVCGDLTSVFDFSGPPRGPAPRTAHPDTLMARVDAAASLPRPAAPLSQSSRRQEPGQRPARPLPYDLQMHATGGPSNGVVRLAFINAGRAGACFSVYSARADEGPWYYTVGPGARIEADLPVAAGGHDLVVHGPNGFLRAFRGRDDTGVRVEAAYIPNRSRIALSLMGGVGPCTLTVTPRAYPAGAARIYRLAPGETARDEWLIERSAHWYDLELSMAEDLEWRLRLSGHMETGQPSLSDPAIADHA